MGLGRKRIWPNNPVTWHETTCRVCRRHFRTNTLHEHCPKCWAMKKRTRKR